MCKVTSKQKRILDAIEWYVDKYNYSPSIRDLADILGIKSPSTVHGYLRRLQAHGLIQWEPERPRTLKVVRPVGERHAS